METRICISCGEEKGLECFGIAKQNKDGFRGECKICMAEYMKRWHKIHPEYDKQYYKDNIEKVSAKNKKWSDANIEKKAADHKKWREANPEHDKRYAKENAEKVAAINKKWCDANPEKCRIKTQRREARKKSLLSDFTIEQWEACLLYFNYEDAYTGLLMNNPSQDHVVPLSKGGGYTAGNIIPCERSINSSKGTRNMLSWFKKQEFYDSERENRILNYLTYIGKE